MSTPPPLSGWPSSGVSFAVVGSNQNRDWPPPHPSTACSANWPFPAPITRSSLAALGTVDFLRAAVRQAPRQELRAAGAERLGIDGVADFPSVDVAVIGRFGERQLGRRRVR